VSMKELRQNRRSWVEVHVLAKFYELSTINYVEKVWFTFWKCVWIASCYSRSFILGYQAS